MKLAIPEFNGRVSPVFDCCRRLLVIDTSLDDTNRVISRDWSEVAWFKRLDRLKEMGVETLLCGGISADLAGQLENGGIKVIPWMSGDVEEVLDAYLGGRLPDPRLTMPGCRRGRHVNRWHSGDSMPRNPGRRRHILPGSGWR